MLTTSNELNVRLVNCTPDAERVVATAARLCYADLDLAEATSTISQEEAAKRVRNMVKLGHHSTLEHVSFTFGVEGVSRALTHQLVRHRIASYSQQSQRYIDFRSFSYVTPDSIQGHPEFHQQYVDLMNQVRDLYQSFADGGIPKEDARYMFPNAVTSKIIISMNGRSLLHFFKLRLCMRAQTEIRQMAEAMLEVVRPAAPSLFEKAGPSCVSEGVCRENYPDCPRKKKRK
jgi:thymidylate synthase (FAD)